MMPFVAMPSMTRLYKPDDTSGVEEAGGPEGKCENMHILITFMNIRTAKNVPDVVY